MNTKWVFWQGQAIDPAGYQNELEAVMQSNGEVDQKPIPDFTDSQGRVWVVNLSLAAARRIDLADASAIYDKPIAILNSQKANDRLFEDLQFNDALQMFFIWCIVKPQADKLEVTEDDFAESLSPQAMHAAKAALWEALSDFFPERQTYFSQLRSYHKKMYETAADQLQDKGDKLLKLAEQHISQELDKQLSDLSTKAGVAS